MPLKRIFPGTYPEVKNPDGTVSNIKTTVVGMDDFQYVLPTMRAGMKMTTNQAIESATRFGLDRFPKFKDKQEATNYSKFLSGKVDKYGFLLQ